MRRLLYCGEWIESHVLHIFMLRLPDFLGYESVVTMAADHRELVTQALALKEAGNEVVSLLGGREVHPINVKVGGFYGWPSRQRARDVLDRLKAAPPAPREVERVVNGFESRFLERLEQIGGFGGKADQLNEYYMFTGDPDYFNEDLARYRALDATAVTAAATTFLRDDARVVLSIVPQGKPELAASGRRPAIP